MPRGRKWTLSELNRMYHMRDKLGLTWNAIAAALNRKGQPAGCCAAYTYYRNRAEEAERKALAGEPVKNRVFPPDLECEAMPIVPRRIIAARPDEQAQRPRYFHDADADMRARIARQGLTAGFMGDPPPGRSALDRRGQ